MSNTVSAADGWFNTTISRSRASTFLAVTLQGFVFGAFIAFSDELFGLNNPASIALAVASMISGFIIISQRFRDMGRNPWMTLLTIIPFVGLWPLLAREKGTQESSNSQINWTRGILAFLSVIFGLIAVGMISGG